MQAKKPKPPAKRLRLHGKKAKNYGKTTPPSFAVTYKQDLQQLEHRLNERIDILLTQIEDTESHICGYLRHGFSDMHDILEDFSSRLPDNTFDQDLFFNLKPDGPTQQRN